MWVQCECNVNAMWMQCECNVNAMWMQCECFTFSFAVLAVVRKLSSSKRYHTKLSSYLDCLDNGFLASTASVSLSTSLVSCASQSSVDFWGVEPLFTGVRGGFLSTTFSGAVFGLLTARMSYCTAAGRRYTTSWLTQPNYKHTPQCISKCVLFYSQSFLLSRNIVDHRVVCVFNHVLWFAISLQDAS